MAVCAAAFLVSTAFIVGDARGEQASEFERAEAALLEAAKGAGDFEAFVGYKFVWTEETSSPLTDGEFQELAASANKRPDHPRRNVFAEAQWNRTHGAVATQHEAWFLGARRWRSNVTALTDGPGVRKGLFRDTAWGGSEAWALDPSLLVVMAADDERAPLHYQSTMNLWLGRVRQFTTGGLNWFVSGPGGTARAVVREERGGVFVAEMFKREDLKFFVRFTLTPSGGVEILELQPPALVNRDPDGWQEWGTLRTAEWGSLGSFPVRVARRVWIEVPGRRTTWRLDSITPVSNGEVEPLLEAPTLDAGDPLRGKVSPRSVSDFRSKESTLYSKSGEIEKVYPTPDSPPTSKPASRWVGWVSGVVVIAAVMGWTWLKKSRGP